jgi:hypothetical protein
VQRVVFFTIVFIGFLYTGHNTPCWITSCNACTRFGSLVFNSLDSIESTPAALLFFRYFSVPYISSRLGKSMSTPSSVKSTGRVGCSNSEPSFKCSSKCSFHLASTWFLLDNSSQFFIQALEKFTRILNTTMSLNLD